MADELQRLRAAAEALTEHPIDVDFEITSGDPRVAHEWYLLLSPRRILAMLNVVRAAAAYRSLIESPSEPSAAQMQTVYLDLFAAQDALAEVRS